MQRYAFTGKINKFVGLVADDNGNICLYEDHLKEMRELIDTYDLLIAQKDNELHRNANEAIEIIHNLKAENLRMQNETQTTQTN